MPSQIRQYCLKALDCVTYCYLYTQMGIQLWVTTYISNSGLRKQPTFRDTTNSFPAKLHLRNQSRNSILMTGHSLPKNG